MYVSQKIKLDLTTEQKFIFENYFGQARFIYNRSIDVCREMFNKYCEERKLGKKAKEINNLWPDLSHLLKNVRAKYRDEEWDKDWDIKINKNIFESCVEYSLRAFEAKFGSNKESYKSNYSYFLKYRSKKSGKYSFTFKDKGTTSKIFLFTDKRIALPSFSGRWYSTNGIQGWCNYHGTLKLKEPIRKIFVDAGIRKILRATIKRCGSSYFIILQLELSENPYKSLPKNPTTKAIGIDLGIKTLIAAVNDDGKEFTYNVPNLKKYEKKIKRLQRLLDRKRDYFVKRNPNEEYIESNAYKKTLILLQNTRLKRNNILETFYHQKTKEFLKDYDIICMEDLKSGFMHKRHNLASAKMRKGNRLYEIRRMLERKSILYDRTLIKVDRFYASTQTCSLCGNRKKDVKDKKGKIVKKNKLDLSDRDYYCSNPKCYYHTHPIDRDLNAAINILREGLDIAGYELI